VDPGLQLEQADHKDSNINRENQDLYHSVIGSLLYVSTIARPDIGDAIRLLSSFFSNSDISHFNAVKSLLRYLKGTKHFGLVYRSDSSGLLNCFADANWKSDHVTGKSVSGFICFLGSNAISWASRKQSCVATSTAESEYYSLHSASEEVRALRNLLFEMGDSNLQPTIIFEDNNSTISFANNASSSTKMRSFDLKYFSVREDVADKIIKVVKVESRENIADIFTKSLGRLLFEDFRNRLFNSVPFKERGKYCCFSKTNRIMNVYCTC
jgi:hypothetical protein